jgi:hypothetical protein
MLLARQFALATRVSVQLIRWHNITDTLSSYLDDGNYCSGREMLLDETYHISIRYRF